MLANSTHLNTYRDLTTRLTKASKAFSEALRSMDTVKAWKSDMLSVFDGIAGRKHNIGRIMIKSNLTDIDMSMCLQSTSQFYDGLATVQGKLVSCGWALFLVVWFKMAASN